MDLATLHRDAREILNETLKSLDASAAVRSAVSFDGSLLKIVDSTFNLEARRAGIYAVAIGKAARPMAVALTEILGKHLTAGVITAPPIANPRSGTMTSNPPGASDLSFPNRWRSFAGGHPLPNRDSLEAASAAFDLLTRADETQALVIFLISGGGSAMMEWPRDQNTTLEDLRKLNEVLISCGAPISEINAVRSAVSTVKAGGLAALAPRCDQVSLIVSDTGAGDEATVASGPTLDSRMDSVDAASVISRYDLLRSLPKATVRMITANPPRKVFHSQAALREHYVLLDNEMALEAAANAALARGFKAEIEREIVDDPIAEGCSRLLSRLTDFHRREGAEIGVVALISGGEFACPVHGGGAGGRNAESSLRWAIELNRRGAARASYSHAVVASAGTDGVDGNSPAAGAIADETTVERGRLLQLDPSAFLEESDAYSYFHALGDAIITGPTGTNVRDVRIMLAG